MLPHQIGRLESNRYGTIFLIRLLKRIMVATGFTVMHEHPDVATVFMTNLQVKFTPCLLDFIGSTKSIQRSGTLVHGRAPVCQACRIAFYAVN